MNEQQTIQQEALLDEALKYSQLGEYQARELWEWEEAFVARWEKCLDDAEVAAASKEKD